MKQFTFILWCLLYSSNFAQERMVAYHAQGKDYYPITVSVSDSETGRPLAKAKVKLDLDERLRLSRRYEPDTIKEPNKTIEKNLYDIQETNNMGLASLYYLANWSDHSGKAIFVNRHGSITVELDGYATVTTQLSEIKTDKSFSFTDVIHLHVQLKK